MNANSKTYNAKRTTQNVQRKTKKINFLTLNVLRSTFNGFTLIKHSEVSSKGFTLIELLIVIVLIGILSTIGLGNFQNAQKKGRDAQRKSDLKQVQNALEAYNNDKGGYPRSNADGKILVPYDTTGCTDDQFAYAIPSRLGDEYYIATCDTDGDGDIDDDDYDLRNALLAGGVALVWGVSAFNTGGTLYIKKLPSDPTGSPQYCYKALSNDSKYQLFAKLENASDPQAITGLPSCPGGTDYNFGVKSPNASWSES